MTRLLAVVAALSAASIVAGCYVLGIWLGLIVQGGFGLAAVYVALYVRARRPGP